MRGSALRFVSLLFFLLLPFLVSCSGSGSSSGGGGDGEFIPNPPVPIPAGALRWSDPQSWGGVRPAAGQVATIPAGKVIALDEDPPELAGVEINGTLIFARRDTNLRTGWITVGGKLEIGSETEPFLQRAVITLNGRPGSATNGLEGGIWINGGTIDLHGDTGKSSWTRLAQTAPAGTNRLVLQAAPGWQPGDRIVVASTDFDMNQAEVMTVAAVAGNVVTLGSPLVYSHWGATESGVEVRAEVGLISRNILIQGNEASSQDGKGGHLQAIGGSSLRISGVEFNRMGRKGEPGRYPVHFHLMGDASGSYVKESAIHHSFNRAVSLHGSHNAVVQGNVAYDVLGHSFMLEDGIETGNLLENNLGLVTRRPPAGARILESEDTPATFWITNPDNTVRGNAAAGSDRFGFWYDLPLHPTGPSATDAVFPRHIPLREFSANSAHSNRDGLFVDREVSGGAPLRPRTGGLPDGIPVTAFFSDYNGFKNRAQGIWIRGDSVVVQRAKLADNSVGVTFAAFQSFLRDSLIVGESANKGNPAPGQVTGLDGRTLPRPETVNFPIRGFEFYDGQVGAENVTFVNFQSNAQRKAGALSDLRFDQFQMHPNNFSNKLFFENSNSVYFDSLGESPVRPDDEDGHRSFLFVDADGSVTGSAGSAVVVNNPFMLDTACVFNANWNAYICPDNYGQFSLQNKEANPLTIAPLRLIREDQGGSQTLAGDPDSQRQSFYSNLLDRKSYLVEYGGPVPGNIHLEYNFRTGGDWIQLAVPYANAQFKVYRDGDFSTPLAGVNSIAGVGAGTGDVYFHDTVRQTLHLKLMVRSDVPGRDFARLDIVP